MKIGSIVECVRQLELMGFDFMRIDNIPIKGNKYTVKEIKENKNPFRKMPLLIFEEICIGVNTTTGEELGSPADAFREIQFPPSLEKEIAECLTRELQPC